MKYSLFFIALFSACTLTAAEVVEVTDETQAPQEIESVQFEETQFEEEPPPPATPPTAQLECQTGECGEVQALNEQLLSQKAPIRISVTGQGVAPMNTNSPAQAYALAKRAAIADGYRMIAERVKGVRVDGQDLIKNMMVKRTSVRTSVNAMVRNANVLETTFKDGLCEVEMEVVLSHALFAR